MVYSPSRSCPACYTVTSAEVVDSRRQRGWRPTRRPSRQLPGLPEGPHDELARLAKQITRAPAPRTRRRWSCRATSCPGGFTYSLAVSLPNGIPGLIEFLSPTQTGYCQQFAFAMAGLARLVGIPSRIAVGYTAGIQQGNGTWKVTTADAHAWPELYFSGLAGSASSRPPAAPAGHGDHAAVRRPARLGPKRPTVVPPSPGSGAGPRAPPDLPTSTTGDHRRERHRGAGAPGPAGASSPGSC